MSALDPAPAEEPLDADPIAAPLRLIEDTTFQADEGEIEVIGFSKWPRIPDAQYNVSLISYQVTAMKMFRGDLRLFAIFKIVDAGPYLGTQIYAAWPVSRTTKSGGKNRCVVTAKSDLYLMLCRLLGQRLRADRISISPLMGCVLLVKTRTVNKNHRQRPYPEFLKYSVVDDVIEIVAGQV